MTLSRTLVVLCTLASLAAWAGKPERDKQKELQPKLDESAKEIKSACGCEVKVSAKWETYKTADEMYQINYVADAIITAAQQQCQSADDKKALCGNVSSIEIAHAADCTVKHSGKTVTGTTNECYSGDSMFTAVFEKF